MFMGIHSMLLDTTMFSRPKDCHSHITDAHLTGMTANKVVGHCEVFWRMSILMIVS